VSKEIQSKIEKVAKERTYWRELRNGLGAAGGSPVVHGFKARINAIAAQYDSDTKTVNPKDDVGIAKAQEGYRLCQNILLDFDIDTCNKKIAKLEDQITKYNVDLKRQIEKKKITDIGGMENLIRK